MTTNTTPLRTILLATDGSHDAASAASIAADLAKRSGAELHLIHAWQPAPVSSYPYPSVQSASTQQLYQGDAEIVLAEAAGALASSGVRPVATHLHNDQPVGAIAALAGELKADLIIVGSRGHGTLRRLILGSVSSGLAHEATRPVLIVRGQHPWPPRRVVVGDDGTSASQQPTALAALIAQLYGVPLLLVHACPSPPSGAAREGDELVRRTVGMAPAPDTRADILRDEVFQRATEMLHKRIVELRSSGVTDVAPEVVFDDPAAALIGAADAAANPALIVVGSRGLGTFARLRLGSVSAKVLHAAAGPVLIVPQR